MVAAAQRQGAVHYNNYFVPEKDLQYVPPYLRDVPETVDEVECSTAGRWPTWLEGTFLRYESHPLPSCSLS
jgi:torulene dioxygenase